MHSILSRVFKSPSLASVYTDHKNDQLDDAFVNLIHDLVEDKTGLQKLNNVDNLVFQGGGVKGVAYLGVIDELTKTLYPSEYAKPIEQRGPALPSIKRIAGTSAGSMLALYLGLNMTPSAINNLIYNQNFLATLDEDIKLDVQVPGPKEFWVFSTTKTIRVSLKNIIISAVIVFRDIFSKIFDPSTAEEALNNLKSIINGLLDYYGKFVDSKFGYDGLKAVFKLFEGKILTAILSFFKPSAPTTPLEHPHTLLHRCGMHPAAADTNPDKPDVSQTETSAMPILKMKTLNGKPPNNDVKNINAEEYCKSLLRGVGESVVADRQKNSTQQPEQNDSPSQLSQSQPESPAQVTSTAANTSNGSEHVTNTLTGVELYNALAELLHYFFSSRTDATGVVRPTGLFTGSVVKSQLIEAPILARLKECGAAPNPNITFQELANVRDKNGNPLARNFYVCSLNLGLMRTEVFSVEHTPNVAVADAIRASMSIPVVFTPAEIRENGVPRQLDFNVGGPSAANYADGGTFNNLPIFIFDELKYCLPDGLDWKPTRRIAMENPRTLAFKLLDDKRQEVYTQPIAPGASIRTSFIDKNFDGSVMDLISLLLTAETGEAEESTFINQGDWVRTAYVNFLGVSTVDFSMQDDKKNELMESGRASVRQYISRANDKFAGEGVPYHS